MAIVYYLSSGALLVVPEGVEVCTVSLTPLQTPPTSEQIVAHFQEIIADIKQAAARVDKSGPRIVVPDLPATKPERFVKPGG
jgi:hypothetical protein